MMRRRGGAPRWRRRCSRSAAVRPPASAMRNLSPRDDLAEAAADFFAMLREFDVLGGSHIVAMPVPDRGTGLAIDGRQAVTGADHGPLPGAPAVRHCHRYGTAVRHRGDRETPARSIRDGCKPSHIVAGSRG